jgi:hypothetical protein
MMGFEVDPWHRGRTMGFEVNAWARGRMMGFEVDPWHRGLMMGFEVDPWHRGRMMGFEVERGARLSCTGGRATAALGPSLTAGAPSPHVLGARASNVYLSLRTGRRGPPTVRLRASGGLRPACVPRWRSLARRADTVCAPLAVVRVLSRVRTVGALGLSLERARAWRGSRRLCVVGERCDARVVFAAMMKGRIAEAVIGDRSQSGRLTRKVIGTAERRGMLGISLTAPLPSLRHAQAYARASSLKCPATSGAQTIFSGGRGTASVGRRRGGGRRSRAGAQPAVREKLS